MVKESSVKTITEQTRETKVCREADVVVVGGGPGGIGAAVSAARNGADTVLIERYGYLGGMATGGLVTIIPNLSDLNGKQQIAGLSKEWIDRLDARGAASYPKKEEWGSINKRLVNYYFNRMLLYVRLDRVCYSATVDAEILKCVLNDMVEEAGVKTYLHSWCTEVIMEGGKIKGVIVESKSGRQAILGEVFIDSTGDGDLLPHAGVDFEDDIPHKFRIAHMALRFWIAGVDIDRAEHFKNSHPEEYVEMQRECVKRGGLPRYVRSCLKNQDNIVWVNSWYSNTSQIDVEELTRVEFLGRKTMLITHDFWKKYFPGFENSFIILTAPQLDIRGSRRMIGEYQLSVKDLKSNEPFEDTIAILPDLDRGQESIDHPLTYVPYRCLLPRNVDNLLVACRAYSSDALVQEYFNIIPHCISFGEAAGTASALALQESVIPKEVNFQTLRNRLIKQGVILPDMKKNYARAS